MLITILAILIFLIVFYDVNLLVEPFATSPGTLLQLIAKGPQDVYLTGYPNRPYYKYSYDSVALPKDAYYNKFKKYSPSGFGSFDEFPFFWG
tara:strand:+ start:7772 stop:8047 length:276 start_codon:yes stop_codon:yes gene_type:complete